MSFLTGLLHLAHPTRKMRQDFQNKRRKMFDLDLDLHRGFMVVIVLYVFFMFLRRVKTLFKFFSERLSI